MGPQDSVTRDLMFDAAENILQNKGYQALTARRVAEIAGFNHQTVYYYFASMDDLVIGAFRRRATASLERLKDCLASDRSLHRMAELIADQGNARLSLEFAAMAPRIEGLATVVREFLDKSRDIEVAVLSKAFDNNAGIDKPLTPELVAMLMLAVSQFLAREAALGFDRGHATLEEFFRGYLKHYEPGEELDLRKHALD